jgi:hypothetical protein
MLIGSDIDSEPGFDSDIDSAFDSDIGCSGSGIDIRPNAASSIFPNSGSGSGISEIIIILAIAFP